MRNTFFKVFSLIFGITLLAFMIMGFAVVFVQLYGIFGGNSAIVKRIADLLKDNSAYVSSVCAFAGFGAYYTKPAKKKA